jgi:two-component system nitrogen regulation sensor histidine kinase NtrY
VNTYRNLTKIPQPNFEICRVSNILKNVGNLMSEELKKKEIDLIVKTEPSNLSFTADEQLIEQVLINLVKNAIQALKEQTKAQIKLVSYYNKRGRVTIQVIDNGPGILPDVLEKIFIPFFTTKQNGSGIGLALSRQILKLHNGSITAQSKPNKETVFTLTF